MTYKTYDGHNVPDDLSVRSYRRERTERISRRAICLFAVILLTYIGIDAIPIYAEPKTNALYCVFIGFLVVIPMTWIDGDWRKVGARLALNGAVGMLVGICLPWQWMLGIGPLFYLVVYFLILITSHNHVREYVRDYETDLGRIRERIENGSDDLVEDRRQLKILEDERPQYEEAKQLLLESTQPARPRPDQEIRMPPVLNLSVAQAIDRSIADDETVIIRESTTTGGTHRELHEQCDGAAAVERNASGEPAIEYWGNAGVGPPNANGDYAMKGWRVRVIGSSIPDKT